MMTTSNEHNNAPAVPQGWRDFLTELSKQKPEKPDYWSSCGQCERNSSTAEDLIAATPAHAPAQEFNNSVADAEIKALYIETQGTDKGWLDIEGSYFISGVVAARRQKKATKPAQEVGLTDETQTQDELHSLRLTASGGAYVG